MFWKFSLTAGNVGPKNTRMIKSGDLYYAWVQMLLQMGLLLRLGPNFITDGTFITLGSKSYYRWDLYYAWVHLLHLCLLQPPPLPHKKRTVPNAGYPNYIMHQLCAEFHALLACVHIKEKTTFLWGLACEKDKLYFSSEASIGVNQLVIMIWKLESYITLTLNINF